MKYSTLQQYLLGLSIVIAFLLPHSNTISLLANPILCVLLVLLSRDRKRTPIMWIPVIPIILSFLLNLVYVDSKAILSTMTILIYFALFPMIGRVCVKNVFLYIVLAVIFMSQIAYFFNISPVVNFFNTYYPMSEEDLAQLEHMKEDILMNRMGGLYHNANQCARYITMLLGFFVVVNKETKFLKILPFILIAYVSIILTGSRTGFVTATCILFFAYFSQQKLSFDKKIVVGLLLIVAFGVFAFNSFGTLRGLEVESGLDNSIGYKIGAVSYYLDHESSIIHLLIGHLDVNLFERVYGVTQFGFDGEIGSLIYRFGFIGFISIMLVWYLFFKRSEKYSRVFLVNLLWIISSTILCSFRASFIFMLFLSVLYSNSRQSSSMGQM